jgi:VanZ family protein
LTRSKNEVVKVWIAAGLWLGIITIESSKIGVAHNTGRILFPVFHFLFGVDAAHFEPWHFFMRKTGHVVGYFILSLLFFRAWRVTLASPNFPAWAFRWAAIAWIFTTVVASLDEWHQAYVPTRGSSVHDVLLDSSAALVAQILIWLWLRNSSTARRTPRPIPVQSIE